MSQPDVIAFLRALLLELAEGTDIEDVPVRGDRLEPGDNPDTVPVILLEDAGALRGRGVPAYLPYRVMVTAFGRTEKQAADVLRTTTDLLHDYGPLVDDDRVGLWKAFDETGPQPRQEPDTRWAARFSVFALYIPDAVLAEPAVS
mgnify:CR=1 FL=1